MNIKHDIKTSDAAPQVFFSISSKWDLTEYQQKALLECPEKLYF